MSTQTNTCPIWGPGEGRTNPQGYVTYVEDAHRAGGQYVVDHVAQMQLQEDPAVKDDPKVKARLTTILVNLREQGETWPEVTCERIEEAKNAAPLPVPKRAERLLQYMVKCSASKIGMTIPIYVLNTSTPEHKVALAWSESTRWFDIAFLNEYLSKMGWIGDSKFLSEYLSKIGYVEGEDYLDSNAIGGVNVTVDGYARIESLKTNPDSAQAFVAMWIDDEMNDAYDRGIEPAILQAGYKPMRIDRKADANKLDDEIIAEIRRSRFLVADMTHGKKGARGSVYFEAGFAMGLDIPIIYTCRCDFMSKVQFDIQQYAHIVWKKGEEAKLQDRLLQRILARIGEGPNRA